jgi:hypothetical protein
MNKFATLRGRFRVGTSAKGFNAKINLKLRGHLKRNDEDDSVFDSSSHTIEHPRECATMLTLPEKAGNRDMKES